MRLQGFSKPSSSSSCKHAAAGSHDDLDRSEHEREAVHK